MQSAAFRSLPRSLLRATARPRPLQLYRTPFIARTVASSVSNKPGSQSLPHAAKNVQEEVGNSVSDLAKTIAGNVSHSEDVTSKNDSFVGITTAVAANVPRPALTMGLAGALPYLGTSLSTVYLARQASQAADELVTTIDFPTAMALLNSCLSIQVTYGAVLLSFAGALHWGMEFAGYGGTKGYPRLMLGAAPVVFAWSTLALEPTSALMAQWVGYTGLWYADMKATGAGWTPKWYSQYRFYLSVLVGTCIIGTLAGTSWFGPAPGHGGTTHRIDKLREQRRKLHAENHGEVGGDVEAVAARDEDAYVVLKKRDLEKEKKEKEEAQKKAAKDKKEE